MAKNVGEVVVSEVDQDLYRGYEEWKGWKELFAYTAEDAEYFAGETRGARIEGANVLEIGFGSGSFLAWARERGARIAATEINPVLLARARDMGFELLDADVERIADRYAEHFDTVVAFDVLEHLPLTTIVARLRAVEKMLRAGGWMIMRFPNAQSPFGLVAQCGDSTHVSALSRSVVEQLVRGTRLQVVRYAPSFRISGGAVTTRVARRVRYVARDLISLCLNAIFSQSIPWDPVVVLALRKR
jgi:2-polyprenyl-3-methyl-5-hydroxy-6-metoxy-1,4-benzoquinol methylase